MKTIALCIMLIQALLCCVSCEKDFIYDEDCESSRKGGEIGGWGEPTDTTITERKDTSGGFIVDVDEWGDTINKQIKL